ncbi:MAG: tRNA isopentenyl-2-thiomethyl-A-37 hydroxylase MiaE [Rhizonema sp. PD37]|nr:tRNA isopentenyl-2-thiomethyl-A-37 hydroxylase MiaE [Rhizonema sp. PD37]
MTSEASHFNVHWMLADTSVNREIVIQQLEELPAVESELLT